MELIGIFGAKRSGKSSLARVLVDDHGFQNYNFASTLWNVLLGTNPIVDIGPGGFLRVQDLVDQYGTEDTKIKYPEVRRLLQRLGTDGCRAHLSQNVWIDALFNKIDRDRYDKVVISDGRFRNEWQAVKDRGGRTVYMERPFTREGDLHISETEVFGLADNCDHFVYNEEGLERLRDVAKGIANVK